MGVCQERNINEVGFHRWEKQFGLMEINDPRPLKELERENAELNKCWRRRCSRTACWRASVTKLVSLGHRKAVAQGLAEAKVCSG
jgi:hypothetical protein